LEDVVDKNVTKRNLKSAWCCASHCGLLFASSVLYENGRGCHMVYALPVTDHNWCILNFKNDYDNEGLYPNDEW